MPHSYYKKFGHATIVMGASFRNKVTKQHRISVQQQHCILVQQQHRISVPKLTQTQGEILALAGCDRLTIGARYP